MKVDSQNLQEPRLSILYIAADGENKELARHIFSGDYLFGECQQDQCINSVSDVIPDIVILEIDEQHEDWLALGEKVSAHPDAQNVGLIFISPDPSNAMRFRCYEAGGDEFIAKPFDLRQLVKKVEVLQASKITAAKLRDEQQEVRKLAAESISFIGEQGVILHFYKKSVAISEYAELADKALRALRDLELDGSLALWNDFESVYYSTDTLKPIEQSLLEVSHARQTEKFMSRGRRCLIQGDESSLLIRNMPEDDVRAGRYRDVLAMLIDGMDLISSQLGLKLALRRNEMHVTQTMLQTSQSLAALKTRTELSRKRIKDANDDLMVQMEMMVMNLGLTEEQEDALLELVTTTEKRIDREVSENLSQEEEMARLLEQSREIKWRNS